MGLLNAGMKMKVVQRPLDIMYLVDTSGSMYGDKIETVNAAMRELEVLLKNEARKNPSAQVNVRIMTFGDGKAKWHIPKTEIENYTYQSINDVNGSTPLGAALNVLCMTLDNDKMPTRGLKPIIVLLSDGMPNDTWKPNLEKLLNMPWGKKALKVAIAIGRDVDKKMLAEFTTDSNLVLEANNLADLTEFIKWTSTLVTYNSQPRNEEEGVDVRKIKIPTARPAPGTMVKGENDSWR